jgi:hypothetical protein
MSNMKAFEVRFFNEAEHKYSEMIYMIPITLDGRLELSKLIALLDSRGLFLISLKEHNPKLDVSSSELQKQLREAEARIKVINEILESGSKDKRLIAERSSLNEFVLLALGEFIKREIGLG